MVHSSVGEMVCDKVVCERWLGMAREAAEEEARDTETKRRTPHKVVGKGSYIIFTLVT